MAPGFRGREDELRRLVERLLRFDTTGGTEAPAQAFLADWLDEAGFDIYRWTADADRLAAHPSFPDDPAEIPAADRPSVAGVVELGDPDAGRTLVLNGHADVVPADGDGWTGDPFEPRWSASGTELTARGAVDVKTAVGVCAVAALTVADDPGGVDGRLVVECVAGEEEGGIGAAAAALDSPYPFERDAAVVAEPTDLRPVVATEGCLMKRLELAGRSAHAARRWRGVDVLDAFVRIRERFLALEAERGERITHPLYERFETPWPLTVGVVEAGSWASNVPASLVADCRFGVAPGESVAEAEAEYEAALADVVAADEWLSAHPPSFERFSVQFEPSETDPDERVVRAVQAGMAANGLPETTPLGETYGADNRHYTAAGVPTVVFGPGRIEAAHAPDETLRWADALRAGDVLVDAARRYLAGDA
jgi:acetylornithine deacetylase